MKIHGINYKIKYQSIEAMTEDYKRGACDIHDFAENNKPRTSNYDFGRLKKSFRINVSINNNEHLTYVLLEDDIFIFIEYSEGKELNNVIGSELYKFVLTLVNNTSIDKSGRINASMQIHLFNEMNDNAFDKINVIFNKNNEMLLHGDVNFKNHLDNSNIECITSSIKFSFYNKILKDIEAECMPIEKGNIHDFLFQDHNINKGLISAITIFALFSKDNPDLLNRIQLGMNIVDCIKDVLVHHFKNMIDRYNIK